jgi:hypothetical protein
MKTEKLILELNLLFREELVRLLILINLLILQMKNLKKILRDLFVEDDSLSYELLEMKPL